MSWKSAEESTKNAKAREILEDYGADHLKTTTFEQTSASKTSASLITLETF